MTELVVFVETEAQELPENWAVTSLADFTEVTLGQSPPSDSYNSSGEGLPFFQGKAEFNSLYPDIRKWCSQPNKVALEGDVLLSVRAPVGPSNVCPGKACIGRGLASVRGLGSIETKFILYLLRAFRDRLAAKATGTTFPAVTGKTVKSLELPLPPLNEQRRIVEKIEELFTRLDAGVEALKYAQAQLKRYRQSVLNAAVTGKLSREWRETHAGELEPASELLERILEERREKWTGKKYKEPTPSKVSDETNLPSGWVRTSLDQLLLDIEAGKNFKCEERPPEGSRTGLVKISAVTWGSFNELESKTVTDPAKENENYLIHSEDFLFSRANTIELVGACVIVEQVNKRLMLSDKVLRFKFVADSMKRWVLYYLQSRVGRTQIEALATGNQMSMRNISQVSIRSIPIPLPPLEEQRFMVNEIERRFSVIDQLEATIEDSLKRSESLRQSILKRAFSGRLVAQDPDDEPASALLERIREERLSTDQKGKKRKAKKDNAAGAGEPSLFSETEE